MASLNYTNLVALINRYVRNYPVEAFHDMQLNRILLMLSQWIESGGTTGPFIAPAIFPVTSANFTTATDCPIPSLIGQTIQIFWNEQNRFLEKDAAGGAEWTDLPGGGFRVLITGFDKALDNFHFYVSLSS